jgi:hypothetical protein
MHFLKYYAFAVASASRSGPYATACWFDAFIQKAQASKAIREHPSYDLVAWTRFLNILRAYMWSYWRLSKSALPRGDQVVK